MTDQTDIPKLSRETVEYTDGETVFEGIYVALADRTGPLPCILLAHDWSGLTSGTIGVAERMAALGYAVFALDAYGKGVRGEPTGDNSHLMDPLVANRGLLRRRLLAGLEAARAHSGVDGRVFVALGYCFGGLCVLDLARAAPEGLLGAISVHGALWPAKSLPTEPISARVLLLHGWEDPIAPPEDVVAIARELTDAGADWELNAYGHAMHAFTFKAAASPERGICYEEKADARSWKAMTAFLRETLGDVV